jgi:hypothetical protein
MNGTNCNERILKIMPIYLTVLIQALLVIHVLKTGRNRYWIWLLLFLPLIGGIAYLVIEVLPEFRGGIRGQRAIREIKKAVNPGADLERHAAAWEQSPNADNARRYAGALMDSGKFSQADEILDQAMSGFFSTEPNLMLLRARGRFESGRFDETIRVLEALQEENPDFKSSEGHLLYARALQAAGRGDKAIGEYRAVATYFPGVEARYRLVLALQENGLADEAGRELDQLINDARLAPAHFRKSQKKWLALANDLRKSN